MYGKLKDGTGKVDPNSKRVWEGKEGDCKSKREGKGERRHNFREVIRWRSFPRKWGTTIQPSSSPSSRLTHTEAHIRLRYNWIKPSIRSCCYQDLLYSKLGSKLCFILPQLIVYNEEKNQIRKQKLRDKNWRLATPLFPKISWCEKIVIQYT